MQQDTLVRSCSTPHAIKPACRTRLQDQTSGRGQNPEFNNIVTQVDRIEVLNRHTTGTASAIRASGDAEAATRAGKAIRQPGTHLVWTQLTQLADMFERRWALCVVPSRAWAVACWAGSECRTCPCALSVL